MSWDAFLALIGTVGVTTLVGMLAYLQVRAWDKREDRLVERVAKRVRAEREDE